MADDFSTGDDLTQLALQAAPRSPHADTANRDARGFANSIEFLLNNIYRGIMPPTKPNWYNPTPSPGPGEVTTPDNRAMLPPPANPLTPMAGHVWEASGIPDAAKALRGQMTEQEAHDFAMTSAAGLIPMGRGLGATLSRATVAPRAANTMGKPATAFDNAMHGVAGAMGEVPKAPLPAEMAANAQPGIRAYHGSPHDFDKFDISKIGTGEGAQSYGHGLYFAENPTVAADYRKRLSGPLPPSKTDGLPPDVATAMREMDNLGFDSTGQALAAIRASHARGTNWRQEWDFTHPGDAARAQIFERYMLQDRPTPGKMYEVNLRAKPEQFLDWDKPLVGQPVLKNLAAVKAPAGVGSLEDPKRTGESIMNFLTGDSWTTFAKQKYGHDATLTKSAASEALREAGIPGVRYLDQGSRPNPSGQKTSNYAIFDDSIIDILKKLGIAGLFTGAGAAATTKGNGT